MESGHICHIWAYLILYITLHAHHEAQESACIPQTQFWASVAGLPPSPTDFVIILHIQVVGG